jgi:hypothetical protein
VSERRFDRRVVSEPLLEVVRAAQRVAPAHLGGGAALSGAHLSHRRTRDLDLFVHDRVAHRELVSALPDIAASSGVSITLVRDGGGFVRARIDLPGVATPVELDLVYESLADLSPPDGPIEGVLLESLADLRASKVTCLLSRSEPRDLVDLLFLERAGFRVEDDLPLALRKDAGIDPAILAWLLATFPVTPLPDMLVPLTVETLRDFRDDLRDRLRALARPH